MAGRSASARPWKKNAHFITARQYIAPRSRRLQSHNTYRSKGPSSTRELRGGVRFLRRDQIQK